jgi:hypothetical protein
MNRVGFVQLQTLKIFYFGAGALGVVKVFDLALLLFVIVYICFISGTQNST